MAPARRQPAAFLTYTCRSCGALVALLAPGALLYDTTLYCTQCDKAFRVLKALDTARVAAHTATVDNPTR